ncbi:MAG: hypothetical protein IJ875_07380, partial [Solobacterium sp.]|nr:hypothetical protein [Solobacterium sp.]
MKKPIEIRDLLSYKYPENLQYSPDGKVLAFQVAYADEEKNQYKRDIYVVKEGEVKPYTSDGISSLIFFEDEETMVIEKHKDNCDSTTTELYRLSIHGGEALPWLTLPFPMHDIKKMKDNFYYALGIIDMNDPDAYKDNEEVRKEKEKKKKEDADYQVVDEVPYWFNGAGFVNKNRTALFEIKVGNKVEVKRLTAKNMDVSEFIIEGDKVYFV